MRVSNPAPLEYELRFCGPVPTVKHWWSGFDSSIDSRLFWFCLPTSLKTLRLLNSRLFWFLETAKLDKITEAVPFVYVDPQPVTKQMSWDCATGSSPLLLGQIVQISAELHFTFGIRISAMLFSNAVGSQFSWMITSSGLAIRLFSSWSLKSYLPRTTWKFCGSRLEKNRK